MLATTDLYTVTNRKKYSRFGGIWQLAGSNSPTHLLGGGLVISPIDLYICTYVPGRSWEGRGGGTGKWYGALCGGGGYFFSPPFFFFFILSSLLHLFGSDGNRNRHSRHGRHSRRIAGIDMDMEVDGRGGGCRYVNHGITDY